MATTPTTTSTSSSGLLQSMGLGSGLDIASLVSQLTTAEMSADTSRIAREQASVTSQVSALGALKSSLATFQASISAMTSPSAFNARAATSSDTDAFTATATSTAPAGSYDVIVKQLAQGQQLLSNNFTGGANTVVGTGTLTISLGSASFNVTIDSSNNTLAGIRNAINSASDNQGVSATLVYGNNGAQLLLTSSQTGASSTVAVTQNGGDGGLSALTYGAGNTANYTVKQAAQDSIVSIAGVDHQSAANVVSGAIDGITLTLKKADPNTTKSLSISNDTAHVTSLVQAFVTAYNTMNSSMSSLDSYDADTKTAGPMFGDALLMGIRNQMSRILNTVVSGGSSTYNSLSSLGVSKNIDGSLSFNSAKLTTAMNTNFSAVANVLSGTNGVISTLGDMLDKQLASSGSIAARNTTLVDQQKQIDNEQSMVALRTQQVQQRLTDKFNAMDTLLGTLQQTSSYLTQQFDALSKANSSK